MANNNLYKIFIAVAERGSITKASEKLYISQPAVTKSIKELEDELKGKLFIRKNRGVELTTEGRYIYEKVKPLLTELDNVSGYFEEVKKLKRGVLRIGTTTDNITVLISSLITKFIEMFPDVEIKIIKNKEARLISSLRNGEVDLVVLDSSQVAGDLVSLKEFDVKYDIIGNKKKFEEFKNRPLSKEEFVKQNLALASQNHTSRRNIDNYFQRFGITLFAKYEMDNYDLILSLIKKGYAIGIVNLDYFKTELENKEIFILPTDFVIDKRCISVVKFEQKHPNPAMVEFEKLIRSM